MLFSFELGPNGDSVAVFGQPFGTVDTAEVLRNGYAVGGGIVELGPELDV